MMEERRKELLNEEDGYWRKRMAAEQEQQLLVDGISAPAEVSSNGHCSMCCRMSRMYLGLGLPRYHVRKGTAPDDLLVAKQSAKPELRATCRSQQRTPLHRAMSARQLSGKPMTASRTSLAAIAGAARGGIGRLP